jgi:regulator of sigma E protease
MISISAILTLVIALLSLVALMIIHEFGHFIIAKKFGVRVDEFGIGYPPRIFGKKIGETIYSINWLPLGAFVRIYGEEGGVDDYRSFTGLAIWKRVLIIIGGVVAFWIASIIIFSVMFMIGTDLPIGDQDVAGVTNTRVAIVNVMSGSTAETAGLKMGDVILEAQSNKYESANSGSEIIEIEKIKDFQDFTKSHAGEEIILTIQREKETINIPLSPKVNPPEGQGAVGVGLQRMATLIEKYPWYQAPVQGLIYTWQTTTLTLNGLYAILIGPFIGKEAPVGAEFAGPLGITIFLANAASYGLGFFLYLIGTISVCIAIFNLFPIPALDGGKLVFLLIEKIKGKPVSVKIEQNITMICFVLLIALSIFITIKFDIPRVGEYFSQAISRNK